MIRYPLSLKVSLWLLLNLLLLAALGIGYFVLHGGLGWDALVVGPSGDRAQVTANVIAGEAAVAGPEARNDVLDRFGSAFGAKFFLFRVDGTQLAGETIELPEEVHGRVAVFPVRVGPGRFPGRGDFGPGRRPPGTPKDFQPGPDNARPLSPDSPRRDPGFESRDRGRFLIRSGDPATYWVGLRVPFATRERGRPPGPAMLVARIDTLWATLRFLDLQSWFLAGTGVFALSILFWLPLVRGITRSLGQLTTATEQIAGGRFDTRVPAARRDEIGRLGESVNRMAASLDAHMIGQKRFLGDVAHELCSPLARLQMATGILAERAPPELRATVSDLREEVQQMSTLVNELLAFTRAGLQQREVALEKVALGPLVQEVIEREGGSSRVTTTLAPGTDVLANPALLSRALGNLVRNALRYSGPDAPIAVSATRRDGKVSIVVEDEGPGVPPEALDRLGEPFFRPEAARTRELGGVGLGLSIVRTAVTSCGGEVRFANRSPRGFRAEVTLRPAEPGP